MEHFVAYHSVQTMGREFDQSATLEFFSRKAGLLKKALSNTVWVVQGKRVANGRTTYVLMGAYIAETLREMADEPGLFVIQGSSTKIFDPPLLLDEVEWFDALKKSQSNFSLGFNRINDHHVVHELVELMSEDMSDVTLIDPVFGRAEGDRRLVAHFKAERDRSLVSAKKAQVLGAYGKLVCQVCGFDFGATYGVIGEGICEVHHLSPIGSEGARVTTLDDLAVVCANCHRVIHRTSPMVSIDELAHVVMRKKDHGGGCA